MDNAARLLLLATNLGCTRLVLSCIEFLETRITMDNVGGIWCIANATRNDDLINVCVDFISEHFDSLSQCIELHSSAEPEYLAALLADCRLDTVNEELKLGCICSWLKAALTVEERARRAGCFEHLLSIVDLTKVPSEYFVDFCLSGTVAALPIEIKYVSL
uniref:BACK domain-containing protein n=1 Tax=Mesocestoides corti TaxID=53468 RepID=A0A5K3FTX0_MESCO